MIKEIWKDKKDYEGHYQVRNFGRVKSIKFGKEIIMNLNPNSSGYLLVNLCKDGTVKAFAVHRLVAEAFIPNPYNLPQVNHRDENKLNNNVDNLEWCTNEYNINYGTRTERYSKTVLQYTLDGEFVREWASANECGRNGFNPRRVGDCCRGERKTHKGYIWKFK